MHRAPGLLDVPALVVLPTSLVFNWQAEAERFAPDLKVLNLHGSDRHARFDELDAGEASGGKVDIALTTYPLLWRDAEALHAREWSLLILDEAQTVKNAASKGAQVIRQIKARHRLGLTGTPLENHLGELWAQFDFLLPGFLGTHKQFTATWRTPIEKHGDTVRRDLLAARLRPFILRRRKEDVATELPPKTIIVRSVGLEGSQRDLYETVRAAMDGITRALGAAPVPIAVDPSKLAIAALPIAVEPTPDAVESAPTAVPLAALAVARTPSATVPACVATAALPSAVAPIPVA